MERKIMTKEIPLSESMEDYLEVILALEKQNKVARAKDIAEKMGVQRGSVTGALKSLGEKKLINYAPYSFITLTPRGRQIAAKIENRHQVLQDFLARVLQVDHETAAATACRMEHAIDDLSMDRLVCFIDYIFNCPRTGEDWIRSFVHFCGKNAPEASRCESCVRSLAEKLAAAER